jgi:RNA polymerase sigma factor (sigma-70 family)
MTKDVAEAEDLTEEAFLQAFRSVGTFRGNSAFSTWLHRVAVNTALMKLRQHKLTPPRFRLTSQRVVGYAIIAAPLWQE